MTYRGHRALLRLYTVALWAGLFALAPAVVYGLRTDNWVLALWLYVFVALAQVGRFINQRYMRLILEAARQDYRRSLRP